MGLFRKNRRPEPFDGTVTVNGVRHPVRDDFATFSQDAPPTRAAVGSSLCCLREYPFHVLMLRDTVRDGGGAGAIAGRVMTMTVCVSCGGADGAWIHDPARDPG